MANFKQLFMQHMDREGVRYSDEREFVVKVVYGGDNLNAIPVYVFFDQDGDPLVSFKCWEIMNFKGKEAAGLIVCNELNKKYRWVKFYLDNDLDLLVEADAMVDSDTCGEECLSMVRRLVNIADEAYPDIARAKFN